MIDKLSPRYRNDSTEGIDPRLCEYLDREYFLKLSHIDQKNPKLLVVFAGGNAVGKSVLSDKLSLEFNGVRLENDAVKRALLSIRPELAMTDELHKLTWQYTMGLYDRLDTLTNNGLIIRDGIITWYFDRILPIFLKRGYELFVIGYNLSEVKMRELIAARGDTPTSTEKRFYELITDQQIHLKRFFSEYDADIMLDDDSVFDHDKVASELRVKLEAMRAKIA